MRNIKVEKPIIFIGTGRSGTTVISEIIMRHRNIAFPSGYQRIFPKNPKINLLRNIYDNPFWRIHGQKKQLNKVSMINKYIFRQSEAYDMWEYLTGDDIDFSRGFLINKKESEDKVNFIHNYFSKMIRYQGRKRLAVKITGPSRMEYLLSIFPDAYFVNINRKPIPTISSLLKADFWKNKGYGQLWWTGAYSEEEKQWADKHKDNPVLLTAFQIKKVLEMTRQECDKCKPNYLDINYEDFVNQPEEEIIKILNFLNLDIDTACLDYFKKNKVYSRNKPETEYFSKEQLTEIYRIFNNK